MANVRCPMCSKLNPPEAEVCAYCGARLKPLHLSPDEQQGTGSSQSSGSSPGSTIPDEADWLRQLRSDSPGSPSQGDALEKTAEAFTDDSDVPDWLARIRDRARSETSSSSELPSEGNAEEPDWMRGISVESSGGKEETGSEPVAGKPAAFDLGPAAGAGSEDEDWISKLSDWQAGLAEEDAAGTSENAPADSGANAAQQPASGAEDEYGWLNTFGSQGDAQNSGPFTVSPEEGGVEWAKPETEPPAERPSSGFGITGFLSSLDEKEAQPQTGAWNEDAISSGEQPASAAPAENLPDWLSSAQAPTEPAAPASRDGDMDLPDWLQGLDKELPTQLAGSESAEEQEVPDWLRSDSKNPSTLGEKPSAPAAQPFTQLPEQPEAGEAPLPDWLSAAADQPQVFEPSLEKPSEPQREPGQEEAAAADLPDWLGGDFAKQEEAPEALSPAQAALAAEEDLPDWFAGFAEKDVEQDASGGEPSALKPVEEQPAQQAAAKEAAQEAAHEVGDLEGEVPDWLSEFQDEGNLPEEGEEAISPLAGGEKGLTASWDAASSFEASASEEGEQPFTVDLPEWLGEEAEAQPAEEGEQPAVPAGEELAQAELPEWVKEMRPIESILAGEGATADVDQRVEKAGPLTGMRGVLPVEDMAAHYRKVPTYTSKLHVTEKQRNQAALFDSILSQESQPLLIQPERSTATGLLVRVLVALVLIVVVAFPVVFDVGMLAVPLPGLFPAENQMFQKMDQGLQSSAPVLLAIEYQPALSGEMRLAASAVVEQLMVKNARIVLVSTVPAGPALGQQLLDDAAASYKTRTGNVYDTADRSANLGYLPGGTISLLDFAQQPQRAAPVTLDNRPAWGENSLLKSVTRLSDFSQVILLTDRAEEGRAWVEQVQPQLGKTPLLVVASAQAAPLLQPYLASGQIAGMTGGLLGGAIYAQLAGQKVGLLFSYLPAYQVGMILAFLIVLVGGVISAIMALVRRNDRDEE